MMEQLELDRQLSIFDYLEMPLFKITKPIRLIEMFAGYGSQSLALKYLGANFEHWKICEWATKSIEAYNDIHVRDYTDYSKDLTMDQLVHELYNFGISQNYNRPMTEDEIRRKKLEWCKKTYNNIIATHNLVDVSKARGKDFNIINQESFTYLLTYLLLPMSRFKSCR